MHGLVGVDDVQVDDINKVQVTLVYQLRPNVMILWSIHVNSVMSTFPKALSDKKKRNNITNIIMIILNKQLLIYFLYLHTV